MELKITSKADRLEVAKILVANRYIVWEETRKTKGAVAETVLRVEEQAK